MKRHLGPFAVVILLAMSAAPASAASATGESEPRLVQRGAEAIGDAVFPVRVDLDLRTLPAAPTWRMRASAGLTRSHIAKTNASTKPMDSIAPVRLFERTVAMSTRSGRASPSTTEA